MKKQAVRHLKARMIRAAVKAELIRTDATGVEWVQAAEGDGAEKPKRFSMTAYTGGALQVNAYGDPVVVDLATLKAEAPIPILLDHTSTQIVGHAESIDLTESRIKVDGVISGGGPAAIEVLGSARNGFPWKASVGVMPTRDGLEWVGEGVSTKVNGKSFKGPLLVARGGTLREVSFVALGADNRTSVKVAASAASPHRKDEDMDFEKWVASMGLVAAELRDDQVVKLRAKYDAEIKAAAAPGETPIQAAAKVTPPEFDLRGVVLAHEKHIAAVQAAVANHPHLAQAKAAEIMAAAAKAAVEIKVKALNEEWAVPRLEAEYVKAAAMAERDMILGELPQGPAIHSSQRDFSAPAIQAAFSRSCGLNVEKHYKPEVLEAAGRYRNLGLQELLLICAGQNGYGGRQRVGADNMKEIIQAAFSTHTITTLLTDSANKILLDGFTSMPQTWREVAQVRNVTDFKSVTAYRMTAALEYEEVGPGGEIQHGTLGQESYSLQAKTYAKMLALTRQDIINDDLGAFNDLRNRLGIGAAIKLNKVFWTAWLAASNAGTFWTSARANLVTSSALAEAGLNTAVAAFRDMAAPDGNMMSLEPRLLLVPTALEATAKKIYVSQEIRDTTASTKYPTANIYQNAFRPVVVPELGNSSYTGYSATTWYLLADPAVLASAVMCFLNGVQSPTIDSADADFDTLGIQFRGYHDFGVAMTEYRASVKATA